MRRRFDESFATSVRAERVIFETLSALGIPYSDAMSTGAEALIIDAIKNGRTGTATKEQLDAYLQYQKDTIDQVSGMVRRFNQRKSCIEAIQATLSERNKPKKKITVYARDLERTIEIPEDQFDPEWHVLKAVPS